MAKLYPYDEDFALDGSHSIKPTPFDAHEQATRGVHVPTEVDGPDVPAGDEYPKAVDHVDHPDFGKEPVVVNSAEEEAAYKEADNG